MIKHQPIMLEDFLIVSWNRKANSSIPVAQLLDGARLLQELCSLLTLNPEIFLWLAFPKGPPGDSSLSARPDIPILQVKFFLIRHKLGGPAPVPRIEILVPAELFDRERLEGGARVLDEEVLLALFQRSLSGSEGFLGSAWPGNALQSLRPDYVFYLFFSFGWTEDPFGFRCLPVEVFDRDVQLLSRYQDSLFYSLRFIEELFVESMCRRFVHFGAYAETVVPRSFMQRHILVVLTLLRELEALRPQFLREKLSFWLRYRALVQA